MKKFIIILLLVDTLLLPLYGKGKDNFIIQANSAYRRGDILLAVKYYQKAISAGENRALASFNLANCYYRLKKPWQSIVYYRRVIMYAPSFQPAYINGAKLYYEMKDYHRALELIDALLEQFSQNYEGHLLKGGCYLKLDALPEAIISLEKAAALKDGNAAPYLLMAEAYMSLKDTDSAAAILEEGVLKIDGSVPLLALLARVETLRGKRERAVFYYLQLADLKKDDSLYLRLAAECYLDEARSFLAIDLLREAQRRNPREIENHLALARLYRRLELFEEAEEVIVKGAYVDATRMRTEARNLSVAYYNLRKKYDAGRFRKKLERVDRGLAGLVGH